MYVMSCVVLWCGAEGWGLPEQKVNIPALSELLRVCNSQMIYKYI